MTSPFCQTAGTAAWIWYDGATGWPPVRQLGSWAVVSDTPTTWPKVVVAEGGSGRAT